MCGLSLIREKGKTDGRNKKQARGKANRPAHQPVRHSGCQLTQHQEALQGRGEFQSRDEGTHASLGSGSRARGLQAEGAEHLREHRDGRGPGRHAAVLPREALAQLMDSALGHAVADHPWEMERKRFREHWPPLVCPQAATPGSRGGREEGQDGHLGRERGRHLTFQVHRWSPDS